MVSAAVCNVSSFVTVSAESACCRRIMEPVVRPHTNWISAPEQLPVVRRGAKQPTYDHPYITQKVLKGPPLELTRAVRNDVFSRKGVREVLDANRQVIASRFALYLFHILPAKHCGLKSVGDLCLYTRHTRNRKLWTSSGSAAHDELIILQLLSDSPPVLSQTVHQY